MKIVVGFIDRLFFAAGVLVFLQLPNFIDQYTQRFGGFYDAERAHLEKYQLIADQNFAGDLKALIRQFKAGGSQAIIQTGEAIEKTVLRVTEFEKGLRALEGSDFIKKVMYLSTNIDYGLAKGTLRVFKPGIPFSVEALACGVFGGVLFSLFFNGLIRLPGWLRGRLSKKNIRATA
jgi:hypothetical protein